MTFSISVVANPSDNVCEDSPQGEAIRKRYATETETKVGKFVDYRKLCLPQLFGLSASGITRIVTDKLL